MQSLRSVSWRQQKRSASTQAPQRSMAMRAASASLLRSAQLVHSARRCLAASAFSSDAPSQPDGQGAWQRKPFPEITTITMADAEAHANRLQLSGNLGSDMQNVQTAFGMVGKIPLYVNTSMRDKSIKDVYTVELYGELASQAVKKLRKGMRVHVEGRLRTEPYTDKKTGAERIQLTIEAEKIYMLQPREQQQQQQQLEPQDMEEGSSSIVMAPPPVPGQQQPQQQRQAAPPPRQQQWQQQQGAPGARQQAAAPMQAAPAQQTGARAGTDREAQLWQELQENRNSFWDNRAKKTNPKAPDFKHKQTGEALWVTSRNAPDWAKQM